MAAQQQQLLLPGFSLPNPFEEVGKLCGGAVAAAKQHLDRLQTRHAALATSAAHARLPPRVVVLPRHMAAIIPGDSTAELVLTSGISNFLNLYNTALIVRLVLTWFPNPPEPIVTPLATICDPYLNLFRGLLPPLGGSLDFSPILAFVVLNLLTNTAAALPAELPKRGEAAAVAAAAAQGPKWGLVSKEEQQYQRRVAAQRSQGNQ